MKKVYVIVWLDQQGRRHWLESAGGGEEQAGNVQFTLEVKKAQKFDEEKDAEEVIEEKLNTFFYPFFMVEGVYIKSKD